MSTESGSSGCGRCRTVWPAQHARCGVCGRLFYRGGHGQKEHLMCAGVRDYQCWNGATFDGRLAADRLLQAVLARIEELPDFDPVFRAKVQARVADRRAADERRAVRGQQANTSDAIA